MAVFEWTSEKLSLLGKIRHGNMTTAEAAAKLGIPEVLVQLKMNELAQANLAKRGDVPVIRQSNHNLHKRRQPSLPRFSWDDDKDGALERR